MPSPLLIDHHAAVRLGHLIRATRRGLKMRQQDLAQQSGIGTSTLRRIEKGDGVSPNVFVIMRLFDELGLSLEQLNTVTQESRDPLEHVTIHDVARSAGVSSQTVSRVVNELDVVNPTTRSRVLDAIETTGWSRDETAAALARRRGRTIPHRQREESRSSPSKSS
jgi:transcriptional regulator with XRE-family HTH domain